MKVTNGFYSDKTIAHLCSSHYNLFNNTDRLLTSAASPPASRDSCACPSVLYPWLSLCIQPLCCLFLQFNTYQLCFRFSPKHSMDKGVHNNILVDSSCFALRDSWQYWQPSSNFYPKPHLFTGHYMESRMTWQVKLSLVLKDLMTSFSPCLVSPSATQSAMSHQEALNSEHHLKLFLSLCPSM